MPRNVRCALIQASNALPHRASARTDPQGDDRQAHEADRAGRAQEDSDSLPAGTFLRPVFLCGAERPLVRTDRTVPDGPTTQLMQKVAPKHQMVIVVPIYEEHMPGFYFNTAAVIDADGKYLGKYRKHHIPALPSWVLGEVLFHAGGLGLSGLRNKICAASACTSATTAISRGRANSRTERCRDRIQSVGDSCGLVRIPVGTRTARSCRRQRILRRRDQPRRQREAMEHRRILRKELFLQSARQDHRAGKPRQRRSSRCRSRSRHDRRSAQSVAVLP